MREQKRNNSIAVYGNINYGSVLAFCVKNELQFCIIKKIKINGPKFRINRRRLPLDHILRFNYTNDISHIPIRMLKCTAIKLNDNTLCKPVNLVEINL
jgi:hypothetical protein